MKAIVNFGLISLVFLHTVSLSADQVCKKSLMLETTPTNRFDVSLDTVKDKKTGLIWKRCSVGQAWNNTTNSCDGSIQLFDWDEALALTSDTWRLPNIKELLSIVEHSCYKPAINLEVFVGTIALNSTNGIGYRTSSIPLFSYSGTASLGVDFSFGEKVGFDKIGQVAVRLVKDSL